MDDASPGGPMKANQTSPATDSPTSTPPPPSPDGSPGPSIVTPRQMEALLLIDECEVTVAELARRFRINRVTANRLVLRLESARYVRRVKGRAETTGTGKRVAHAARELRVSRGNLRQPVIAEAIAEAEGARLFVPVGSKP